MLAKDKLNSNLADVCREDLIEYGMIPELIGRLPVVTTLDDLSADDLLQVLVKPKNALIEQYKKLFMLEGSELEFRDSALKTIVEIALARKAGARSLRSVLEESLLDIMYELPEMDAVEKVIITKDVILTGKDPLFRNGTKRKSA